MTVKVRPYKRGGWEVDIMLTFPGKSPIRERRKAPVDSKTAAKRWGEERERQLYEHMANADVDDTTRPDVSKEEIPTLAEFIPRYVEGHCKANRLRPSTIKNRTIVYDNHLIPALGRKRLDKISAEDLQRFKAERAHLKNSSVNLMLTLLRCILSVAVEWGVIDKMPVRFKKLREAAPDVTFYDFEQLDRLVLVAEKLADPCRVLMVLLGGEAGLRCGEMRALQWTDIDLKLGTLTVSRTLWLKHEGPTKGGRSRTIPLADRLKAALVEHRQLGGPVLRTQVGTIPSDVTVRRWLNEAQTAAGFAQTGPHVLRHTFCSHLAMRGMPARAIQALAGHQSITTTERYMHLAPGATRDAIEALRRPADWRHAGDDRSAVLQLQ